MKKLMLSLLILSLVTIAPGTGLKASAQDEDARSAFAPQATVLKVPRDYATIQAAVKAASPGDTIKVAAGVYNENVVISTFGLRLLGVEGAVIDGAGLTGSGIQVLGTAAQPVANVEVSGFEVRDFQCGIVVQLAIGAAASCPNYTASRAAVNRRVVGSSPTSGANTSTVKAAYQGGL